MATTKKPASNAARKPRSKTAPERTATGFRVSVEQLERIDARAREAKMSRTDYVVAAALGELPDEKKGALKRLEEIEKRLDLLEQPQRNGS